MSDLLSNKAEQEHASRISFEPHRQAAPAVLLQGDASRQPSPSRYRTILVPLDGTPFAEHALPFAISIARRAAAELHLVHVHQPWDPGYHVGRIDVVDALHLAHLSHHKQYLYDTAARIARNAPVPVKSVLIEGRNIAARVSSAANGSADLVVMATRARGRLARGLRGSNSASLIRRLDVPLLLVRGERAAPDLSEDVHVKHVLTAVDGSRGAESILEEAAAIADLHEARHTLLRVIEPLTWGGDAFVYIQRLLDVCEEYGSRIAGHVIASFGTVAQAILSYARDYDADLIALAPRSRGRIAEWFSSSLTYDVVRGTKKPVLLWRPQAEGALS